MVGDVSSMIGGFNKLKVGDSIVVRGKSYEIAEIYEQDFYDDADSRKYNLSDKSYIDIEFKDIKGKYHHWKSNIDGGHVIYADSGVQLFSKYFLTGENTLNDTVLRMLEFKQSVQDVLNVIMNTIGDTVWEYDKLSKLKVGDTIVVKGGSYKIQEIYEQDFYDDADSRKHGLPDKSYIDIEFKDHKGKYRRWRSNVDGGKIIYAGTGSRMFSEYKPSSFTYYWKFNPDGGRIIDPGSGNIMFSKYFLTGNCSLKDAILKMQKNNRVDARCILSAVIDTIGDTTWEDK